jgi:hypothetical protein
MFVQIKNYRLILTQRRIFNYPKPIRIIPWKCNENRASACIESIRLWTPSPDKVTQIQASFRTSIDEIGDQQGFWPAFWVLGDSCRRRLNPVIWPHCAEIDIFEQMNGHMVGNGIIYCDESPMCGLSKELQY